MSSLNEDIIEYMSFHPIKQSNGLVGFVSFKYGGFSYSEIGVHKLREPKGKIYFRLTYPETKAKGQFFCKPVERATQEKLDLEINSYLLVNYPNLVKK
jgi:hypothetical protein